MQGIKENAPQTQQQFQFLTPASLRPLAWHLCAQLIAAEASSLNVLPPSVSHLLANWSHPRPGPGCQWTSLIYLSLCAQKKTKGGRRQLRQGQRERQRNLLQIHFLSHPKP